MLEKHKEITSKIIRSFFSVYNMLGYGCYEMGLLLNFGPKPKFIRKAYVNQRKGTLTWIGKR